MLTRIKRRGFVKAMLAAPAAPVLLAQQPPGRPNSPADELPKLEVTPADQAGDPVRHFFNDEQFAAMRAVGNLLMPAMNGSPGALEAGAAEFLDFLLSESPADRQHLYRAGLDALNTQARGQFGKPFAALDSKQAGTLLAPLRQPWTYDPPADALGAFLVAAKQDVRSAVLNSREWNAAASSGGGRRQGGVGLYWNSFD